MLVAGIAVMQIFINRRIDKLQEKIRESITKADAPSKACWKGYHGLCEELACPCACHPGYVSPRIP